MRNRLIPDYVLLDGHDPKAYIFSVNITRRHMSKGQRAIAAARLYPEPKRGRGNKGEGIKTAESADFSERLLRQARFVVRHASDLADSVTNGSISLDTAYEEARIRKGQADTYESRFNALKAAAPDLADMVTDGQLKLEEAEAAQREREERARRNKKLLAEALHALSAHAYVLDQNRHDEVTHFITHEAELYKHHNCRPVDEFIQALEIFAQHAAPLLARINEQKAEKENAEKGG